MTSPEVVGLAAKLSEAQRKAIAAPQSIVFCHGNTFLALQRRGLLSDCGMTRTRLGFLVRAHLTGGIHE